jgi:hypothetical protein
MSHAAGTICALDHRGVAVSDAADTIDVWSDEFTKLYLLSFLLTADKMLAEKCFSDTMDHYVESQASTLADWAKGAGRIAIILRAVQMMRPAPKLVHSWSFVPGSRPLVTAAHQPFSAITALSVFERFVFVIAELEGYSAEECAAFLECSLSDIRATHDLADTLTAATETRDGFEHTSESLPLTTTLAHQHFAIC